MLLAIDFDGTLCVQDTVDWFSERFAPEAFAEACARFAQGEIDLDTCLALQVAPIDVPEEELVAFLLDTVEVRPGARELVDDCRARGMDRPCPQPVRGRDRGGAVLLLDQVSRNVHRGSPLAFAADTRALRLARGWIGRGFHQKLPAPRARWLIMPYEHAENLDAQHRGVALFQTMGLSDMAYWAQVHLDIIARFGRFPHRNPVLGRTSTPEELAFLKAGGFAG